MKLLSLLVTLFALLMLCACEEDYDPTEKECGYPGNCCWEDNTCNTGYRCNVNKPIDPAKYPGIGTCEVEDGGVTPADTGVTPADTGVTPADAGVTPADEGVTPADEGATPADEGVSPADDA